MIHNQALPKLITFNEFLDWKPEKGPSELQKGMIVEMPTKGKHEEISGFLAVELAVFFRQNKLSYFLPKQALVKVPNENKWLFT